MARHTLYAYVEGSDFADVADELELRLFRFVDSGQWRYATPKIVNQRHKDDPSLGPGDLPDWDLGLNIDLPDPPEEPAGWFGDIERIVGFLAELHVATGRDFVIGIGDNESGISDDLFGINSASPDVEQLRRFLGVRDDAS